MLDNWLVQGIIQNIVWALLVLVLGGTGGVGEYQKPKICECSFIWIIWISINAFSYGGG